MIFFSAGEIDVREEIGREKLTGHHNSCEELAQHTVIDCAKSLQNIAKAHHLYTFVLAIALHACMKAKNGKKHARRMRSQCATC